MGWGIVGGEDVEFRCGEARIKGHVGRPRADGRAPAVIFIHGINGLAAGNRHACDRFGDEGYVALGIDWKSRVESPPDREIIDYVAAAADWLRQQEYVDPERIAIGGYCMGGTLTYLSLAEMPWAWAGLIYHGTLTDARPERAPQLVLDAAPRIQAPLLMLHGASDQTSPVENTFAVARELNRLGKRFALKIYSGAGHAFMLPDGTQYHAEAGADAWRETLLFLDDLRRR